MPLAGECIGTDFATCEDGAEVSLSCDRPQPHLQPPCPNIRGVGSDIMLSVWMISPHAIGLA